MQQCNVLLHADDEVGRWVASRVPNGFEWVNGTGTGIGFTLGEKLIAGAVFFRYNGASCEIGFASDDPRWMTRDNFWRVFHYAFEYLNLKRLTSITDASNLASRKLNESLGFVHEATLKDAAIDGDQLVYVMMRRACKWLMH